jgi:hypothetical protein
MKESIRIILEPYFKEFKSVESDLDQFTFIQNVLETGTKIFQMREDYGLGNYNKNEIAQVWNELYGSYIINVGSSAVR